MASNFAMVIMAWLHIFTALGWLGAVMFFVMVLRPTMAKLSPPARGELVGKLMPRYARYVISFGVLTLIFGAILALQEVDGNLSAFSPATAWGLRMTWGMSFAVLALLTGLIVTLPTALKMGRLMSGLQTSPQGQTPPEILRLEKRISGSGFAVMTLLILALILMVAAARL